MIVEEPLFDYISADTDYEIKKGDCLTVLKKIEEVIKKKLGGDSEGGTAPLTSPKPPRPRGPNTLIELEKIPE